MESTGDHIIDIPEDEEIMFSCDPRSGFVADAPKGSLAKGEAMVTTGGGSKTIPCAICHGLSLQGLGEVLGILGRQAPNSSTSFGTSTTAIVSATRPPS